MSKRKETEYITLKQAKKDGKLRQPYIDRIMNELYNEDEYRYHSGLVESINYLLLFHKPVITEFNPYDLGKRKKIKIFISGLLFEERNVTSDNEIKSILGDHELSHVRDIFCGISLNDIKSDYKRDVYCTNRIKSLS